MNDNSTVRPPPDHRSTLSTFTSLSLVTLGLLAFVSCGWMQPKTEEAKANPPVVQPVDQPAGAPYQMAMTAQTDSKGVVRSTVTLTGGAGPSTALLRLQLPEGAAIAVANAEGGVVQYQDGAAVVLTQDAMTTLHFDITGIKSGTSLTAILEEEVSSGRTLPSPITITAEFPSEAGELVPLSAAVYSQTLTSTDQATPDVSAITAQLLSSISASNTPAQLSTLATTDFTVPAEVDRSWLAYEMGDVNKDKKVTLDDVLLMTNALLGKSKLDDSQKFLADLKDDGRVTADDLALLIVKRLSMALGVKFALPSVHPKNLVLNGSLALMTVGNAGSGVVAFKVTPNAAWMVLKPVTDGIHPTNLGYLVSKKPDAPANGTGSLIVEANGQKRSVAIQTIRTLADSTQDTTAAGVDSDHNGIRDEVDALIATDPAFNESPAQNLAAQNLARALQTVAQSNNPTKEEEVKSAHQISGYMDCLKMTSSGDKSYLNVPRLLTATFNTVPRLQARERLSVLTSGENFDFLGAEGCK